MAIGNWTLVSSEDVDVYYRGVTAPAKVEIYSQALDGSVGTLYKTITSFQHGEIWVDLAAI